MAKTMLRTLRTITTLCVGVIIFSVSPAWSQHTGDTDQKPSPSLADTEQWIVQTFKQGQYWVNGTNDVERIYFAVIGFDGKTDTCTLTFNIRKFPSEDWGFFEFVDLTDIDPNSIQAGAPIQDTSPTFYTEGVSSMYGLHPPYVVVSMKTANDADKVHGIRGWMAN
jgi:hypothetical protein